MFSYIYIYIYLHKLTYRNIFSLSFPLTSNLILAYCKRFAMSFAHFQNVYFIYDACKIHNVALASSSLFPDSRIMGQFLQMSWSLVQMVPVCLSAPLMSLVITLLCKMHKRVREKKTEQKEKNGLDDGEVDVLLDEE